MAHLPMRHVLRSLPPWSADRPVTECGLTPKDHTRIVARALAVELANEWATARNAARAAGVAGAVTIQAPDLCSRCLDKMKAWRPWHADPVSSLYRLLDDYQYWGAATDDSVRARAELWALAELVGRDPDGYARLVQQHIADAWDRIRSGAGIGLQGRAAR
jgi:hypothetical protein